MHTNDVVQHGQTNGHSRYVELGTEHTESYRYRAHVVVTTSLIGWVEAISKGSYPYPSTRVRIGKARWSGIRASSRDQGANRWTVFMRTLKTSCTDRVHGYGWPCFQGPGETRKDQEEGPGRLGYWRGARQRHWRCMRIGRGNELQ